MKNLSNLMWVVAAVLVSIIVNILEVDGQQYFMGSLQEDDVYEKLPRTPTLLTRDYTVLPSAHSLVKYCPTPGNQAQHGTCVGWATAYGARTILDAVAHGWGGNQSKVNSEAFSPLFVYMQIKFPNDYNCQQGAYISRALDLLKREGAVKFNNFDVKCANSLPLFQNTRQYRIDEYSTLFGLNATRSDKINKTKKALSQNRPVVISMKCYRSFHSAKEKWSGVADSFEGYHAMTVVGYDDNKHGGAFLLMNSWGTNWGAGGYTWIAYNDYVRDVNYGYQMYLRSGVEPTPDPPKPKPEPDPAPDPKPDPPKPEPEIRVNLAGAVRFELATGEDMTTVLHSTIVSSYYKTNSKYITGNRFRIYISTDEPSYIYLIASDKANNVVRIFPDNGISALLPYRSINIAIPDERSLMQLEASPNSDTDYICVLYSYKELDIDEIVRKIKSGAGDFHNRVARAFGNDMIPAREITYGQRNIQFSVKNSVKTVAPVILEIGRR